MLRPLLLSLSSVMLVAAEVPHGHVAAHGGCLNEIGMCENGHAEVKIEGTKLRLWLVGGGTQTATAVRVPDASITLHIAGDGKQPARTLVLQAAPLLLAEEQVGDCSYFEGSADWLAGIARLQADMSLQFRGAPTAVHIDWPNGAEADAGAGAK